MTIDKLKQLPFASIAALAPELEGLVTAAKKTVSDVEAAQLALQTFRTIGVRKQFIDKCNAQNKTTRGVLDEMPHKPGAQLPTTFADDFFIHDSREEPEDPTIESVTADIADLKQQLAEAEALLVELQAAAKQAAEEEKQDAELEAQIAAEEKQLEDRRIGLAALKAKRRRKK